MSKRTFKFEKLVRDKIPDIIKKNDIVVNEKKLSESEFLEALKDKLLEEALEFKNAKSADGLKEELADSLEVIYSILKHLKIDFEDIEKIRYAKNVEKGSFEKRIYVSSIEVDESNPAIKRYLAKSEQ